MYKKLFRTWRKYQELLKEDVMEYPEYGSSFSEMREFMRKNTGDKTWIFFDTETTGLKAEKDFHQVTQIAAIAVDVKNWDEPAVVLEKFNIKVKLVDRTLSFMDWETKKKAGELRAAREAGVKVAPFVKKVKRPESRFKPHKEIFKMTHYGISPNPEKAKRRALIKAYEKGQTQLKLADVPEPVNFVSPVRAATMFTEFLDKYPNRVLVAQNAPFDVKFLSIMYERSGKTPPDDIVIDTVMIFRKFLTPALKKFKANKESGQELDPVDSRILNHLTLDSGKFSVSLGRIIKAFDVENKGWHDALADVTMLLDVLKAVINFLDVRPDLTSLPPEPLVVYDRDKKPSDIS